MLFEAIQLGSQIFHKEEKRGHLYDHYLPHRVLNVVGPETITQNEVRKLREFVNAWGTRCQWSVDQLTQAITGVLPELSALSNTTILGIDFQAPVSGEEENYSSIIEHIFECIATCGPRYEMTGASKILHMLNPDLFVMSDGKIRGGYACPQSANGYASVFLPRIQIVLRKAIKEAEEKLMLHQGHAMEKLCQCGHTLAKVIDEYNYVKYRWGRSEVWEAEFS